MAGRFPLPAEGGIEKLIAEAYGRLPGPEPARVTQIAERLASHRPSRHRVNRLPWWIVILALSGAAAATWYAGETWRSGARRNAEPSVPDVRYENQNETGKAAEDRPAPRDPRGLIYKRETQQ